MASANSYASPSTDGGNRENLTDILTILEPEQTPVVSAIRKGPGPRGTFTEVLADELDKPQIGGQPEGKDITSFSNKATKRQRFGNYIQIQSRDFGVTDVQQLVDTAAVSDEYQYAKMKTLREMKRDIEATICSDNERQSGNGTDQWKTRGLFRWLRGTANSAPSDIPVEYRTPAAQDTSATITETVLNNVLQSLFETHSAKNSYMGVFSPNVVEKIDLFTRIEGTGGRERYTVNDNAATKTINLEVKVFNSSFGRLNVLPSVFLNWNGDAANPDSFDDDAGLILDQKLLELQYMSPLTVHNMDDEGGGKRGYAKTIYSLCCKNPKGLARMLAAD
jgi:hypothetical protein